MLPHARQAGALEESRPLTRPANGRARHCRMWTCDCSQRGGCSQTGETRGTAHLRWKAWENATCPHVDAQGEPEMQQEVLLLQKSPLHLS